MLRGQRGRWDHPEQSHVRSELSVVLGEIRNKKDQVSGSRYRLLIGCDERIRETRIGQLVYLRGAEDER